MVPKIYLAPIRGVTDITFRNTFPKHFKGLDIAIAPFIATSHGKKPKDSFLKNLDPQKNHGIKTIPQILSKDPDDFISLANTLNEMGNDIVNWNLGCPFPMAVNKGKGCGMLPYPPKIESFLDKVFSKIKSKISIKLRIGMVNNDEILQLIPIFNNYPICELIIHPRTGKQMYSGKVDLEVFEKCINISKHSIVYNGDIDSLETYKNLSNKFNSITEWMIGRGILNNPFLAEEIKSLSNHSHALKLQIIHEFHNELFEEYSKLLFGPTHIMDKMKNLWKYMGDCFENSKKIQKKIKKTQNKKQYLEVVNYLFENEIVMKKN